jgi:polyhydroxyalkanoate synthesis regulator phasin
MLNNQPYIEWGIIKMEISLKNLVLAGIGAMAYSYEKAAALVDDMVKKGELTINQGKELNEELKRKMSSGNNAAASGRPLTGDSLKEVLSGLNLATKQDLDELKERISKLSISAHSPSFTYVYDIHWEYNLIIYIWRNGRKLKEENRHVQRYANCSKKHG